MAIHKAITSAAGAVVTHWRIAHAQPFYDANCVRGELHGYTDEGARDLEKEDLAVDDLKRSKEPQPCRVAAREEFVIRVPDGESIDDYTRPKIYERLMAEGKFAGGTEA